ncbi:MAG: hypothetical protein LVQ95_02080 [Candidatus Micrarchaeales archaeon]|nr:hypothetical protein [Candidatus Micrarchaeales archaeon]
MAAKPSEAKTTIDTLTELLRSKGKMEINKIADSLSIDTSIAENLVKVLEDANLVKVTYEVGKMYVEPMLVTREQEQAFAATRAEEKTTLDNAIAVQKVALDKYETQLGEIELSVKVAQRAFQQKFPDLERQLDGINKIYSALEDENSKIDSISKKAESVYSEMNKKITDLYGRIEGADVANVEKARAEAAKMQDTIKRAEGLSSQLDALSKSKDKALAVIRSSIEEQLKALEKELDVAESNINEQLKAHRAELEESANSIKNQVKVINDLVKQVNNFRHEKESAKKALNDARSAFNDEYSKLSTRVASTGGVLKRQISDMLVELNNVKGSFGDASKLYDQMQELKGDIDGVQKTIDQLKGEASKLTAMVQTAASAKASADIKDKAIKDANAKIKSLSTAVSDLQDQIVRLKKKAGTGKGNGKK